MSVTTMGAAWSQPCRQLYSGTAELRLYIVSLMYAIWPTSSIGEQDRLEISLRKHRKSLYGPNVEYTDDAET